MNRNRSETCTNKLISYYNPALQTHSFLPCHNIILQRNGGSGFWTVAGVSVPSKIVLVLCKLEIHIYIHRLRNSYTHIKVRRFIIVIHNIMSRAFYPPDTLSKDDIRTIADVRREIWTNSMRGLGVGSLTGYTLYSIASIGHYRWKLWKLSPNMLSKNMAFLSVLLGGAIGSFVMSVTTGQNEVHNLHPIFTIGAFNRKKLQEEEEEDDETVSTHLTLKELSILRQQEQQQQPSDNSSAPVDRTQLERNRLYRRATLTKKMEAQGNRSNHQNIPSTSSSSSSSSTVSTFDTTTPTVEADGRLLSDQEVKKSIPQQR